MEAATLNAQPPTVGQLLRRWRDQRRLSQLELALEGLRSLPAGSAVCIVTDSRLMLDSMTKWIHGWKRKGWKTAAGGPVKNQDLVTALDAEIARHAEVRWHWVRGHETGDAHAHKALNDRADGLAVAAARAAAAC